MANYGPDPGATPPPQQPGQVPPGQGYPPPQGPGGYVPQQGMAGPPVAPPPRRSPCLLIAIIVIAVLVVCGGGSVLAFGGLIGGIFVATQPVADAGNAYMTALRDGDYNKAFSLSAQALQQDVGDAKGLESRLSIKQPQSWSFTSRNITNDQGSLSGTTTYKDGSNGTVDMVLSKEGNAWKVAGINLK